MMIQHLVSQIKGLNKQFKQEEISKAIFQQDGASARTAHYSRFFRSAQNFASFELASKFTWPKFDWILFRLSSNNAYEKIQQK